MSAPAASAPAIELRLRAIGQLFNTLDPSPFHERDLDQDAEDFIVGWARELPADVPLRIVVHLQEDAATDPRAGELRPVLAGFFEQRAAAVARDLRETFRFGRRSLMVSLPILAACMVAATLVDPLVEARPLARFLEEGLLIFGWVVNWRPAEILLFEWWPLARRRDLYRRLAQAEVEIRSPS
ncbi:MAG: hypothetical protein FJX46_03290 [Alphaproteobacteria bacterium]|nr:hypothetical protein [Alphaproteobacteria bacterium]